MGRYDVKITANSLNSIRCPALEIQISTFYISERFKKNKNKSGAVGTWTDGRFVNSECCK